jgi:hypothetical protein
LLGRDRSYFVKHHSDSTKKFFETDIFNMLQFLIDNIFAMFGGRAFQQSVGIPGMKLTYLYVWYPSFQAQWDRRDEQNHQSWNYLAKGHHLYSGIWSIYLSDDTIFQSLWFL